MVKPKGITNRTPASKKAFCRIIFFEIRHHLSLTRNATVIVFAPKAGQTVVGSSSAKGTTTARCNDNDNNDDERERDFRRRRVVLVDSDTTVVSLARREKTKRNSPSSGRLLSSSVRNLRIKYNRNDYELTMLFYYLSILFFYFLYHLLDILRKHNELFYYLYLFLELH